MFSSSASSFICFLKNNVSFAFISLLGGISGLIVCRSGSRTIKSPIFSKHLLISKSQKYFKFSSLNLNLKIKNIITCIIWRAFLFLFLQEKWNSWLNSWFFLYSIPRIRIRNTDPDPWTQMNVDPTGSLSTSLVMTLVYSLPMFICFKEELKIFETFKGIDSDS